MPTEKQFKEIQKKVLTLEKAFSQFTNDFAALRLDLKSANIIQDEPYTPPAIDELSERDYAPRKPTKTSKKPDLPDPFA